jgi:lipoate-protein ligase A
VFIHLPNAYGDAALNMAIDASLLETIPEGFAAFRHYGWTEPALTFGYSQAYSGVVATAAEGLTLCRRMTGGGMVDHRNDWTYALILQKNSPCAKLSSTELYAKVHGALSNALAAMQFATRLAPCPRKCGTISPKHPRPDQCFIQPAMNDVLTTEGRKVAGAAMKRTRKGLLLQGSIDRGSLPLALDYTRFSKLFVQNLLQSLTLTHHQPKDLRPCFNSTIIETERSKFASEEWTARL